MERKASPSIRGIPPGLEEIGKLRKFIKGEMLFHAQDKADGFYYVLKGQIRVYRMDEQGKELEVVRLGPGDFLGEAVVFVSDVFPVFAQAVLDTETLFFERSVVEQKVLHEPHLADFFIRLLARKCVALTNRIESLGLRTVRQRLVQYLLARCSGDRACEVELPVKKAELAKILGTISETLSRNLKQMQEEGLIQVKGRLIIIKNCPGLRQELGC
ncbi:MAG: Crp/Fnr family transcriptional regulator [Candidatus Aminicenantales bacterium]